jgi:hypothetical protein
LKERNLMPPINIRALLWFFGIIIVLSQSGPILAALHRVGLAFYEGLVLPIANGPESGRLAVLAGLAALFFATIWSFLTRK